MKQNGITSRHRVRDKWMRVFILFCLCIGSVDTWEGLGSPEEIQTFEATISVDAERPGREISPLIYGTNINYPGQANGFSQHLKTQAEHDQAINKWFSYLPLVQRLGPTIIRFPGGLNANEYIWTYGIGPMADRIKKQYGWNGYSIIGTDEFLTFCEKLHAEAMITANINKASEASLLKMLSNENYRDNASIAADWVEYCNAPDNGSNPRGGVDWAAVRARNGHKEPYRVKYWEMGNEIWQTPFKWYKTAVQMFSKEMKSVDPTIKIGVIALPPEIFPPEKYTPWFQELLAEAGGSFDFWIHHAYTPATSGKVHGFALFGVGASISTKVSFPRPGPCSLCFTAEPVKGAQKVGLYLDGKPIDTFSVLARKDYCTKVEAIPGDHLLRLALEKGNGVMIGHMMKKEDASGSSYIDLKNSPELYYMIVSGANWTEQMMWPESLLGGKPLYITEYNSCYEIAKRPPMLGQAYSLREALNVAQYLQSFVRKGYPVATQWLLFGDMNGLGLIEGVGIDPNHGGVMGRKDPRPRPSYYILKLYRDHLQGKLLPVDVTSPRFHIGPPAPRVAMGFVSGKPIDIPFINAVASLSDDGKEVALLVNNLHYDKEFSCKVRIKGFIPAPEAGQYIVNGATSWANNEPEQCPQGECVSLVEKKLTVSGPEFSCIFPAHSASAIVLNRK